jgi:hypothetical protein
LRPYNDRRRCSADVTLLTRTADLTRTLASPERLYMSALALSGVAAVWSVALPAAQRGYLVACIVGGTLGAAIGSFSIDTFLLSRPEGWVLDRGRWWVLCLLAGSVGLAAAGAAAITAIAGIGSYPIAMSGAAALTVFNASAALSLRLQRFGFVYRTRAAGGLALVGGYAWLYARGDLDGARWSVAWLAAQALAASVVAADVLRRARGFGVVPQADPRPGTDRRAYRKDLGALGRLHVGICAQMLTFRLDQVLLARYAGAGPLGVYALAVAAVEFAQAGAVVKAQRILARREPVNGTDSVAPVVKAALPVAVLAVGALAVLGMLAPEYRDAWLLGALLLPGAIAVSVGKTWSATLLKRRGERATTNVALLALAVAVPCYLVLVTFVGAVGAAIASSFVYTMHALGSRLSLRHRTDSTLNTRAA